MIRFSPLVALLPAAAAVAQFPAWQRAPVLEPRSGHAMVYDAARGTCLVFGGFQTARYAETWEWDGVAWAMRRPAHSPVGRRDHAMAIDTARHRVVLFGGNGATGGLNDTWEWDGVDWTQRAPTNMPSGRDGMGMAYDAARGETVLFGGFGPLVGDTWTWDGTDWTLRSPATQPGGHGLTAMAYDPIRQRVVLFGGSTSLGNANDTWEWDGTDWAQILPANAPPARQRHALAWDPDSAAIVLFGGSNGTTRYNEVWHYDGVDWTQLPTPATAPVVRDRVGLAYDQRHDRLVVFGGRGPTNSINQGDTWEWDGASWEARDDTRQPAARAFSAFAGDTDRGEAVLFGGNDAAGAPFADTWIWDGSAWRDAAPTTAPGARTNAAMCFDRARGQVLLFGGSDALGNDLGDTWTWADNGWQQLAPANAPAPRTRHGLVFDAARGRAVLFGGYLTAASVALADTWEWDGTQWSSPLPASAPPARQSHAMVYDARRGRTVVFGGAATATTTVFDDTWEWDGSAWTQRTSLTLPPARARAAATFDAGRGRTVVFGGVDAGGTPFADTWEWDGTDWAPSPSTGPSARSGTAMVFDARRNRPLAIGGQLATGAVIGENWEFADAATASAAPFGQGCGGSLGVPALGTNAAPVLGDATFALRLSSLVPNASTLLALGFERDRGQLGGGCTLYLPSTLGTLLLTAGAGGEASWQLPLPNAAWLLGVRVFAQGVGLDPTGPYLGQATFSRGLEMRFGR